MKKNLYKTIYIIVDFLSAFLGWIVFYFFRKQILSEASESLSFKLVTNALVVGLVWLLIYYFFGSYEDIYRKSRIKEIVKKLGLSLLGTVLLFFLLLLDDQGVTIYTSYYKLFAAYFCIHFLFAALFKSTLLTIIKNEVRERRITFNSILIGSGASALEIYDAVEKNRQILGFNFIGYIPILNKTGDELSSHLNKLGEFKDIGDMIRTYKVENVIVALESCEHECIDEILKELETYNVKVSLIPNIYEILLGAVKVNHIFSIPLIEINQDLIPAWQKAAKRGIDIIFSLNVLLVGSPIYLLVACITKFSSSGPVFYIQERVGKDGIPFKIIKFRSMHINAESSGPALSNSSDSRITSWGKFMRKSKLDEIPQFYNVLIGDMSLVGPRPERQFFIDRIVTLAPHYRQLQRVKPGITSLGQVKYGYAENVDQMVKRLKYDIIYIENMSIVLDVQIVFYTLYIILSGRTK